MASATEIKQVQLPNSTTKYDLIAKNGIFYIEGTGSTAGTWLGSHADITEYYEGLTIAYKIPVAGASTTTLNINSLGAVPVVKNATTAISTSYPVNTIALLTYTLDGTTARWKTAEYGSSGDITGVTAGAGLTGGGSSGSVTLNVGAGSGIIVNDNDVAVNTGYTTSGKNYKVAVDSTTGGLYVNVPWTDTNTDTDTGATSVEVTGSGNAVTTATYDASTRKLTLTKGATYNNYSLPTAANGTLGGVKTTSTVTSTSGLTACPIISGVPYYKDTNTADTNTTYTLSTGDENGQIKVTPSSGDPYNVSVRGLGSNAYTSTSYLPTAGGNISGHIYLTGAKESSSTGNTSQIVFGTSSNNHVAISSNNNALVVNPTISTTTNQIVLYLDKESQFPGGLRWSDVKNKTNASTTAAGLMSAADKTKLDDITAITNDEIDSICGTSIAAASEVAY